MLSRISFDYSGVIDYVGSSGLGPMEKAVAAIHEKMHNEHGFHSDSSRWIDHTRSYDYKEFDRIKRTAAFIRETSDVLFVIGLGESSLGVRAAIDLLAHPARSYIPGKERDETQISFVPKELYDGYTQQIQGGLEGKDFSILIVSESGTTDEELSAVRFFRGMLEEKFLKKDAEERIHTTFRIDNGHSPSPKSNNRHLLFAYGGLLSMAVTGVDVEGLMDGASEARDELVSPSLWKNSAYRYATTRHFLSEEGMAVEWLVSSNHRLSGFGEWRRWLFGNDEGSMVGRSGLFPAVATSRKEYEALVEYLKDDSSDVVLTDFRINGVTGIPSKLEECTRGLPKIVIKIPQLDVYTVGYLLYFFEKASVMDGYLRDMMTRA